MALTIQSSCARKTKSCPRCLEELFSDMQICYGCLYDFSRTHAPAAPAVPTYTAALFPQKNGSAQNARTCQLCVQTASADFRMPFTHELTVGRDEDCDVCLHAQAVSGMHVRFFREQGDYFVEDLHSDNKARINGRNLDRKIKLLPGDCVDVCGTRFTFLCG